MYFKKYICKIFNKKQNLRNFSLKNMACSRYEYVKNYERDAEIIPNVWIVVRVDGKGFHKFSKAHNFNKPNDKNALNLMSAAAIAVMQEFKEISLSFGESDEYSFVFRKNAELFNRRCYKLLSYVTSLFTSAYVFNWPKFMTNIPLQYPPCFDGRIVLYPTDQNLRDYLSWRQADVHVNNLYNTAFWNIVLKGKKTVQEAEAELRGTLSKDKNELLFSQFNINYNNEPAIYRKGTILLRKRVSIVNYDKTRKLIIPLHEDMIRAQFWLEHAEILSDKAEGEYKYNDVKSLPQCVQMQMQMNDQMNEQMNEQVNEQMNK